MRRQSMRIYREQRTKRRNMQNARITYKDVGRKETVHEVYCLFKSLANSKDYTRFREIPNEPYTGLNYENTDKNLVFVVQLQNFTPKNIFEELN